MQRGKWKRECVDRLVTAWGWIFDALLILINLTDVVSDCLVAAQFYRDGHATFFWLIIASLLLANIIYTIYAVEVMCRDTRLWKTYRIIQYVVIFPFAQLAPTANWFREQFWPSSTSTSGVAGWNAGFLGGAGAAAEEEAEAIAASSKLMERLDKALAVHFRTHLLFYVESVVEAIPQSIVQLLAVTFLDTASPLQVFSLSLSLVSIISKGYVLSRAFAVGTMAFKFVLGAHDVFSLFYIVSTVISRSARPDVHLFGDVYIDYLSAAWLIKIGVNAFNATIAGIVALCVIASDELRYNSCSFKMIGKGLLMIGGAALVAVPGIIAAEGGKLLWINLLITSLEPQTKTFPTMAMYFSFVNRGDYAERQRYVVSRFVDATTTRRVAGLKHDRRRHQHVTGAGRSGGTLQYSPFQVLIRSVIARTPFVPHDLFLSSTSHSNCRSLSSALQLKRNALQLV